MEDYERRLSVAKQFLEELEKRRISVSLKGDNLGISAPAGTLDDPLKNRLREQKEALIEVLTRREAALRRAAEPGQHRNGRTRFPLSFAQRRLWFLEKVNPASNAYVISGAMRMQGRIDIALLEKAYALLTQRHEALRTRFGEADGVPYTEVLDQILPDFELFDIPGADPNIGQDEIARLIESQMPAPFDLSKPPLISVSMLRLGPEDHVMFCRIHHIVSDGWSLALISRELLKIYEALMEGRNPDLPKVEVHSLDHALWEHDRADSGAWRGDLDYWVEQLKDAPALTELPTDRPHPERPSYRGARATLDFSSDLVEVLQKTARDSRTTLYMIVLAALQVLLHRHSKQETVLIGSPVANRMNQKFENTIGCLINNIVLRGDLEQDMPFRAYLQQVKETLLEAQNHSGPPFDMVVEALRPERTPRHAAVFQVLFTLMSFPENNAEAAGFATTPIPFQNGATRTDLSIEMTEFRGLLKTTYEYATDLFDAATISRLHDRFETLLWSICRDPDQNIQELDIVSAADKAQMAELSSVTSLEFPQVSTAQLIDAKAGRSPEDEAVVAGESALDYGTLVRRANGLAHQLVSGGVEPQDLVAVALEPGCDLVVSLLAVWKAGAAYVPLDPHHPPQRLADILEDAQPGMVISTSGLASDLPDVGAKRLDLDLIDISESDEAPRAGAPEDLAYVIYTSGSTGRPKGVEIEHRNLVSFLEAMRKEPGLKPGDRLLSVTTPSFDIAGLELWLPLTTGATVVLANRSERLDGRALASLLSRERIAMMQATPATWRLLLDSGWSGMLRLKALCGGEAMPRTLPAALLPRVGSLWNMYGPTETTIWSTCLKIEVEEDAVCIGKPIANTRIAVMDDTGNALPSGVVGELCIAGAGVARGYRNRPNLTAEKFTALEFPGSGPVRAYRTGDLVRQRSDGQIIYVGRNDFQVKIRGFRIELGEIEARLATLTGVADCAVDTWLPEGRQVSLVAYVVPSNGFPFDTEKTRSELRKVLPEYMVPAAFVTLDAIPLTPNRKVDRRALPQPKVEDANRVLLPLADVAMSDAERRVAEIWCNLLDISGVGLHQSFFDVGGYSMILVTLHERLSSEFKATLPLVELFRLTTVALQAAAFEHGTSETDNGSVAKARQRAERFANV